MIVCSMNGKGECLTIANGRCLATTLCVEWRGIISSITLRCSTSTLREEVRGRSRKNVTADWLTLEKDYEYETE